MNRADSGSLMCSLGSQLTTHVVRSHRNLRRRLPEVARLVSVAEGPASPQAQVRAARHAAEFLDRNVLGHADVEDVLIDRYLEGYPSRGSAARLRPAQDTLRRASARLHDFVETPTERINVSGMLHGVSDILERHVDDEWDVLLPALSALDEAGCTVCEPMLADTAPSRPSARLYLPVPLESAQHMLTRQRSDLRARVSGAAAATVRRLAGTLGIPVRDDLGIAIELVPAVQSDRVGLHVGKLWSDEIETVINPVEFELVLSRRGDRSTELEAYHTMTPERPLTTGAPANELTEAAIHVVIGELASIADDRSHAPTVTPQLRAATSHDARRGDT